MLVDLRGAPIWRPESSVNIWNGLHWLSSRLIIFTEQTNIYNTLTSRMAKNHEINIYINIFDIRDRNFMSLTATTLKFKIRWFPNEGRY